MILSRFAAECTTSPPTWLASRCRRRSGRRGRWQHADAPIMQMPGCRSGRRKSCRSRYAFGTDRNGAAHGSIELYRHIGNIGLREESIGTIPFCLDRHVHGDRSATDAT